MKSTYRILFFTRKTRPNKDGLVTVAARITIDGETIEFNPKLFVNPEIWNPIGKAEGKTKEARELNQALDKVRIDLKNHYDAVYDRDGYVSPEKLRDAYLGIDIQKHTLLSLYDTLVEQKRNLVDKTIRSTTLSKYLATKKRIADFIFHHYKKEDITLREVNYQFLTNYEIYLKSKCGWAIECKFDKNIKLGDIESKEIFTRKTDTAWSQLIEAQANRNSQAAIIVLDISLTDNSILKKCENVGFIPEVGFIAIIDSQKGDYSNLSIAYMLARDIVLNAQDVDFDKNTLMMLVNRIIKDINEVVSIRSLVNSNIENNKAILKQLEKSILLMEFNQEYLMKFLKEGSLTKDDLLAFYQGESIKDKYKVIEKNIEDEIMQQLL